MRIVQRLSFLRAISAGIVETDRACGAGDLFEFDPASLAWVDLTPVATGSVPSPRINQGFAEANGTLYVFGGGLSAYLAAYREHCPRFDKSELFCFMFSKSRLNLRSRGAITMKPYIH